MKNLEKAINIILAILLIAGITVVLSSCKKDEIPEPEERACYECVQIKKIAVPKYSVNEIRAKSTKCDVTQSEITKIEKENTYTRFDQFDPATSIYDDIISTMKCTKK